MKTNSPNPVEGDVAYALARLKSTIAQCNRLNYCAGAIHELEQAIRLNATPPAQILRPVELPGYTDKHQCMSTACDAAYEYKLSVIEALRQQGYEVKND